MSQKTVHFRKDQSRSHRCCRRPRMYHHIHTTFGQAGSIQSYRLSDTTPQQIPPDRFAQLAADRDAKAGTSNAVPQIEQLNLPPAQRLTAGINPPVLFSGQQATRFWKTAVQSPTRSGSQTLAALGTTTFDDEPPRPGPHSSPEAVRLGALAIVGTKSRPHKYPEYPEGSSPCFCPKPLLIAQALLDCQSDRPDRRTLKGSF